MGKSTAAKILSGRGVPVVDTDELARQLVSPGEPALAEIQQRFGPTLVDAAGQLRRDELARLVFADSAARQKLEAILHPRIRERWLTQVEQWRAAGHAAAVVVIPLLFETAAEANFDSVICVACSAATQRKRLHTRGWSDDEIGRRIAAQWPVEKKMALARHVVWTEGQPDALAAQLARILD
jgi:dephospho-CoA kinase